ncbi:LysR family transcriptional regulator [Pacificibacter marinus]|uniref:LysR family transcriptional regulator n=1 Tax=Pacificibacter marinus TaxID=658057 RepID=UPI001C06E947|nr:LysR family transcriptional regulator [Pacificibacter marinus]MBU2867276.1 LysR family transcriptional regulator [Pacificibacter marinus]
MLHSRLLRYLDMVARTGSIRRAAERLNISASSINRQILALEEEMGTPIFERLPKTLRLTAVGEVLIEHIRETLKEHSKTQDHIERLRGNHGGVAHVFATEGLANGVLLPILAEIRDNHPSISIDLTIATADVVSQKMVSGEADIAIAQYLPDHPTINVTARFTSPVGAVFASDHPIAHHASKRLADYLDHGIVFPDASQRLHRPIADQLARAGLDFKPHHSSNSVSNLIEMARHHGAIAILPLIDVIEDLRRRTLVFAPLSAIMLHAEISLARHERGTTNSAINILEIEIRNALRDIESQGSDTGSKRSIGLDI